MNFTKDVAASMPIRLVDASGNGVAGMLPADISDGTTAGNVTFIKADRTQVSIALVANTNWFEASSSKAPGLYHILVPANVLDQLGSAQLAVFPAASAFRGTVFTATVTLVEMAAEATMGKWQIFSSGADANRLVMYKADGVTVLKKFDLKDAVGDATVQNPFARLPL